MSHPKYILTSQQHKIILQITALFEKNEPLNIPAIKRNHPKLLAHVYQISPFWGWKRALEAAGISYKSIKTQLSHEVECKICGYVAGGLVIHLTRTHQIDPDEYLIDHPNAELISEASRAKMMGRGRSHDPKHKKAKVIMPHWEAIYSPEYILDRLFEFHRRNIPLNLTHIYQYEPSLVVTAKHYFGSWDDALGKIGLNPKNIRLELRHDQWAQADVIQGIQECHKMGLDLRRNRLQSTNKSLCLAAKRLFTTWDRALMAAGISIDQAKPKKLLKYTLQDRKKALEALQSAAAIQDPIEKNRAIQQVKKAYGPVINKYFGVRNWGKACKVAGIPSSQFSILQRRYMTQDDVIREIRRRKRAGLGNRFTDVYRKYPNKALYNRAKELFGNWTRAVTGQKYTYKG